MATTDEKLSVGGKPQAQAPERKRAYQRPELRKLGTVAELTMTGGNTTTDQPPVLKKGGT
jgi:hypothetical protein